MSKKIMSIMLAVFMLASLCVVGVTSASAAVKPNTIAVDGEYAHAGDIIEFSMAVDLDGCWGQNGQMTTYYDATKLKFLRYSNDTEKAYTYPVISASGSFMPNLTGNYGTDSNGFVGLHVNYTDATGGYDYSAEDGIVFRYRFEVLEDVENLSSLIYNSIDVFKVFTVPGDPEYTEGAIGTEIDLVNGGMDSHLIGGGMLISGGYTPDTTEEPTASDTTEATDPSESDTTEEPTASDTTEATDPSESDTTEEPTASDTTEATDPSESDTTEEPTASDTTETPDPSESDTTKEPTASTTETPEIPQTGDTSTAVVLMVAAIMAAGVVIFARKKSVK